MSDHTEASKRTTEYIDKLTIDFFNVKRQNLTISSQLGYICQHLGITVANNASGGGFSSSFTDPPGSEPYVHPNKWEPVNSLTIEGTPPWNEESSSPAIRLDLGLNKTVIFSENNSGTPANGVGAPICGVSDSPLLGVELLEQIKQIIKDKFAENEPSSLC